jgi:hypothetical protein
VIRRALACLSLAACTSSSNTLEGSPSDIFCGRYFDARVSRDYRCQHLQRPPEEVARDRARYLLTCGAAFGDAASGISEASLEQCTRNAVNLPCGDAGTESGPCD